MLNFHSFCLKDTAIFASMDASHASITNKSDSSHCMNNKGKPISLSLDKNQVPQKPNPSNDNFSIEALLSCRASETSSNIFTTQNKPSSTPTSKQSQLSPSILHNPPFPQLLTQFRPRPPPLLNFNPVQSHRCDSSFLSQSKQIFQTFHSQQQQRNILGEDKKSYLSKEEAIEALKDSANTLGTSEVFGPPDEEIEDATEQQEAENGGGVTTSCEDGPPSDSGRSKVSLVEQN